MIKKYKKQLILSSAVILLPVLIGLALWNTLPDRFATHFGFDGQADGWSSKAFAIFAIPLMMLATHWICFFITSLDPKAENQTKKAFGMIFWICPVLSLFTSAITYSLALDAEFNLTSIMFAGLGLMFIGIGNYLPKCRQNSTLGIKLPWTLANEENWNATHRLGGKLWVGGGVLMLPLSFVPMDWGIAVMLILIIVMTLIPTLYSWRYYKKQQKSGVVYNAKPDKTTQRITKWAWIIVAIILVMVTCILLTGDIGYTFEDDCFIINASYWNDLTVSYDQITGIELREGNVSGTRVWGFGSWRLLLGNFENEEFGHYVRYTYCKPESCIVITCGESVLVLSGIDAEETSAIYETITANVKS